jgi:hypothetical protein
MTLEILIIEPDSVTLMGTNPRETKSGSIFNSPDFES